MARNRSAGQPGDPVDGYLYMDPKVGRSAGAGPRRAGSFEHAIVFMVPTPRVTRTPSPVSQGRGPTCAQDKTHPAGVQVGGGNYLEYSQVVGTAPAGNVLYGGTEMFSSREFLRELQLLGK
jgi:hypothetical protein